MKEQVKNFWLDRAKNTEVPRVESLVNFENDKQIADLRVETEISLINTELQFNNDCTVVDLGAGNGRFTLFLAPNVKKVVAVEYISDFTDFIIEQAEKSRYTNIEVINMPAENYCNENYADIVFVSGLLNYLEPEQYNQTIKNISKTLKAEGTLFLRETISILDDEFIVNKYSDELEAHYCSLYRTKNQLIDDFHSQCFQPVKCFPFFSDGSVLNKRAETRLYCFIFTNSKKMLNNSAMK